MSEDGDGDPKVEKDFESILSQLQNEVDELYSYRDLFFEHNPFEMAVQKSSIIEEKKNKVIEKFEQLDENHFPSALRARYLYLKGRAYNITSKYDVRASQCLSKAVKLNPRFVECWNELGECYWKNLNIKDAKNSFEGALKHERNKVALRCLSIVLRQEATKTPNCPPNMVLESVDYAKQAVAMDCKDGSSWCVLGNAYLCQYFMITQDPKTLKSCMTAYKQAELDPVARGQPDLYYNRGVALKYDEKYEEALENFTHACKLDPSWNVAIEELNKLMSYLTKINVIVRTKGKIKAKKIQIMIKTIDKKMLGPYALPNVFHSIGRRKDVKIDYCPIESLKEGVNEGKIILGKVVGSIYTYNDVPFTFAIVDEAGSCACVTVYNWADGQGVIIGDSVAVIEPTLAVYNFTCKDTKFDFKSIRVNNPMMLVVNGRRIGTNQFVATRVTTSYKMHDMIADAL